MFKTNTYVVIGNSSIERYSKSKSMYVRYIRVHVRNLDTQQAVWFNSTVEITLGSLLNIKALLHTKHGIFFIRTINYKLQESGF